MVYALKGLFALLPVIEQADKAHNISGIRVLLTVSNCRKPFVNTSNAFFYTQWN